MIESLSHSFNWVSQPSITTMTSISPLALLKTLSTVLDNHCSSRAGMIILVLLIGVVLIIWFHFIPLIFMVAIQTSSIRIIFIPFQIIRTTIIANTFFVFVFHGSI